MLQSNLIVGETEESKQTTSKANFICGWIVQVLLWIFIILLIVAIVIHSKPLLLNACAFTCFFYICYLCLMFCGETFSFLKNREGNNSVLSYMSNLFNRDPTVNLYVRCYHYSRGTNGRRTTTTTHTETRPFYYKSARDCSGPFKLNTPSGSRDSFIKLRLNIQMRPSSDGTDAEYYQTREYFFAMNRNRDTHFVSKELLDIEGYHEFILVSLGDNTPCGIGVGYYTISIFLGLAKLYEAYLNCYCFDQSFTIVKEISTKRDLHGQDMIGTFSSYNPTIVLNDQVLFTYQARPGNVNVNFNPELNFIPAPAVTVQNQFEIPGPHVPNQGVTIGVNPPQNVGFTVGVSNNMTGNQNQVVNTGFNFSGEKGHHEQVTIQTGFSGQGIPNQGGYHYQAHTGQSGYPGQGISMQVGVPPQGISGQAGFQGQGYQNQGNVSIHMEMGNTGGMPGQGGIQMTAQVPSSNISFESGQGSQAGFIHQTHNF